MDSPTRANDSSTDEEEIEEVNTQKFPRTVYECPKCGNSLEGEQVCIPNGSQLQIALPLVFTEDGIVLEFRVDCNECETVFAVRYEPTHQVIASQDEYPTKEAKTTFTTLDE